MKATSLLNIVLSAALLFLCVKIVSEKENIQAPSPEEAVLHNIMTRTSIRSYQEDMPVEPEQIDKLLRAGMAAPTAVDKRPWHFVAVTDRGVLDALAEANPYATMLKDAPLAIVVCGNMEKTLDGEAQGFWVQDLSAVSENILLAAHGMGLGAVWTGIYPLMERCRSVAEVLNLPTHLVPFSTIVIGYPKNAPGPKDKYDTDNISYNTYKG